MDSTGSDVATEIVVLRAGLSVTRDALQVLWHLEEKGHDVRLDNDGGLLVSQGGLTEDERQQIRSHKAELVWLVTYCNEVVA